MSTREAAAAKKRAPKPAAAKPPVTALNARIVSSLTTPLGARPGQQQKQQLPPGYKPVARKVTLAIVALPVAIVTSYVLWQRLVLGEERKLLVPPAPVEGEGVERVQGRGRERRE